MGHRKDTVKCVMSEEEFLLKWNNHQTNFVDVFNHLLRDDSFVDVTLVCGGEAVLGHKMVLAACSPLLHRILRDNPCRHPVLILSDVPAGDMRAMMKFIYQGEVSVSQSELASFLKTADNLQIRGLAEDKGKDKDKEKEHRPKEDRKRKDRDGDRSEGRSGHKRQRASEGRGTDGCPSPLSRSRKSHGDSHSSHRSRSKASSERSPKNGGALHPPVSKHVSSRNSCSTKTDFHDIPSKIVNASKENSIVQVNSSNNIADNLLLKNTKTEDVTIKTEPLDYSGEMVWTEGHNTINSDILDDPQPLVPLTVLPDALDGVTLRFGCSPNLTTESNDDSKCDEESRGDMSTASDDINANTTAEIEEVEEENLMTGTPSKFRGGRKGCCYCGKTFCDNYTLRRHMVTHISRERQFECPMCSAAYSRKDHLMAHIRRKHPISLTNVETL